MEFADKIRIEQQYNPIDLNTWMVATQTIFPEVNFMGFAASGYFSTIYAKYVVDPVFDKKQFGRTILKFDSLSNKRSSAFWDASRPIPLLKEEIEDFKRRIRSKSGEKIQNTWTHWIRFRTASPAWVC